MIRQHLHPWWRRSSVTQNKIILTLTIWGNLFVFKRVKVLTWMWYIKPSKASDWLSQNVHSKCTSCYTVVVLLYVEHVTAFSCALYLMLIKTFFSTASRGFLQLQLSPLHHHHTNINTLYARTHTHTHTHRHTLKKHMSESLSLQNPLAVNRL